MVMKHSLMALPLLLLVVAVLPTTFVYAQTTAANTTSNATTTTSAPIQLVTPSAAAQQIINNTQAECEQAQFGRVLIFGGSPESRGFYPNPFLWNAVDGFKAQGYTITAIEMIAAGNKSIDNEFHVIMSK
jgi:hypothetical protein